MMKIRFGRRRRASPHRPKKEVAYEAQKRIKRKEKKNKINSDDIEISIPRFQLEEVHFGSMIGNGKFTKVFNVERISVTRPLRPMPMSELAKEVQVQEQSAQKVKSRSPFVIKLLTMNQRRNPQLFFEEVLSMQMELHLLHHLRHNNIIGIHGWSCQTSSGVHFLILDRINETLEQRIRQWGAQVKKYQLPPKADFFVGRLRVLCEISSALLHMHSRSIICRNLKPSSIGFDVHGRIKLFDFRLARNIPADEDKLYQLTMKIGPLRYMAPEVFNNEPYNLKADCHSFGLVVWQVLSLKEPYPGVATEDLYKHVCFHQSKGLVLDPEWPTTVLNGVLERVWNQSPLERPRMCEMHDILQNEVEILSSTVLTLPAPVIQLWVHQKRNHISNRSNSSLSPTCHENGVLGNRLVEI